MNSIAFQNSILEKIINFDFERYYTKRIRTVSHVIMWSLFAFLMYLNYYLGYKFDIPSSILFSLRLTLCNIIVFYLLFYLIVPFTIRKNRILIFLIFIPVLIQLWLVINFYFYYFLIKFGFSVNFGTLNELIKETEKTSIVEIISPKNVLAHVFEVIMSLTPFFFVKISFDLSKTYSKSMKATRQIEKLNYENLAMENKFLQTQLNPHFLFNTLNNLYSLASTKNDLTPELILKLSDIMRYTLYEAAVENISIEKELYFIENYFDMEQIRYPTDYTIEKNIICERFQGLKIAPLLTFVFIENAFKYGLMSDKPYLKMHIEIKDRTFFFTVENDKSLQNNHHKEEMSIGIENARRRLELLYPQKHTLQIKDELHRFLVELKINID